MRLIIAGGRDYQLTEADLERLDAIRAEIGVTEVVSGGATGADLGGEEWARRRGLPVTVFRADWSRHGRSAGPRRNRQMADYADAVVLFPGGRGTANMHAEAVRAGLVIFDLRRPVGG